VGSVFVQCPSASYWKNKSLSTPRTALPTLNYFGFGIPTPEWAVAWRPVAATDCAFTKPLKTGTIAEWLHVLCYLTKSS
jgi:hypothetical protein